MITIQRSKTNKKRFVLMIGDMIYHISCKEAQHLLNKLKRYKELKGEKK